MARDRPLPGGPSQTRERIDAPSRDVLDRVRPAPVLPRHHRVKSMSSSPARSMTRRSTPRAMPAHGGRPCSRPLRNSSGRGGHLEVVAVTRLPRGHVVLEASSLLPGIRQLVERVGELEPSGVHLEAPRPAIFDDGQRRELCGPASHEHGLARRQPRFDPVEPHLEEQVVPTSRPCRPGFPLPCNERRALVETSLVRG